MKLSGIAIIPMVINIAIKLAERRKGVAILTPSEAAAKTWADVADYAETPQGGDGARRTDAIGCILRPDRPREPI